MNCSSNTKSSSSESSSRSYGPRKDIPGACAAAFSLSFSFSLGCIFGPLAAERVVRPSEGSMYGGVLCLRLAASLDARGGRLRCGAWLAEAL